MDRVLRWTPMDGIGAEHLRLRVDGSSDGGVAAESVVIGERRGLPFGLRYSLRCDALWRVREVELALIGEGRRLHLAADGEGRWHDGTGRPLPVLDGCIDVDISATPFTNTLPIRRLRSTGSLEREGTASAIRVVYIPVPELTPRPAEQRYTCLDPGRLYRYEGLFRGFAGDLPVDADGLVLDYPETFRRLPADGA
jgi:hypothetical protein